MADEEVAVELSLPAEDKDVQVELPIPAEEDKDSRIENTFAPGCSACIKWHPTNATITVDGKSYEWNVRAHRKMRHVWGAADSHPPTFQGRIRFWCWEPRIVTWHICWVGVIANTLWVVNGLYTVWPERATAANPTYISYITGVVGAFLFIVGGYLGYVEAINQTFHELQFPTLEPKTEPRTFRRPKDRHYGSDMHPLGAQLTAVDKTRLEAEGYPLIYDEESKDLVKAKEFFKQEEQDIVGRNFNVRIGGRNIGVTITSISFPDGDEKSPKSHEGYCWWTWQPDLQYIGIFNALVFFISTIIFFIPATVWYPMDKYDSPKASLIFWDYILQIIPSIGFVYVGLAAMAEATGSWVKPKFNLIGWWIGFFNTVGGVGFLLYPVLFLPEEASPEKDHDGLLKWGASMATFWGSCCFWIAGILQCIEFSSQHPIHV